MMYHEIYFWQLPETYEEFEQLIMELASREPIETGTQLVEINVYFERRLITLFFTILSPSDLLQTEFKELVLICNRRHNHLGVPLNIPYEKYKETLKQIFKACKMLGELKY